MYGGNNQNGPWEILVRETLDDTTTAPDPVPSQKFTFVPKSFQFVKFQVLSTWKGSGGLQYFSVSDKNGEMKDQSICFC